MNPRELAIQSEPYKLPPKDGRGWHLPSFFHYSKKIMEPAPGEHEYIQAENLQKESMTHIIKEQQKIIDMLLTQLKETRQMSLESEKAYQ